MHYKFEQTNQTVFTPSFDSFWLFYDFVVNQGTKTITINEGMFAVYISQKPGEKSIKKPEFQEELGNFEISDKTEKQKIKLNGAKLLESRLFEFSNEIGRLHLFNFWAKSEEDPAKKTWIEPKWTSKTKNPERNDDATPFLNHELEFGDIKKRYIYWLSAQENHNGTRSVALAMPFLNNSPFALILSKHQEELPAIKISSKHGTWQYPEGGAEDLPGEVKGFAMVSAGAFKSVPLSSEIDEWYELVNNQQIVPKDVITKLSKVVQKYTYFSRTLETVTRTDNNSVVSVPSDKPIEVLYLEQLNTENRVQSIIT